MELIERGVENQNLYYNLGNTYFRLNKLGYSVLYFEKALSLKPFDRDVRENLEYVKESLRDRIVPLYSGGLFNAIRTISSHINLKMIIYAEIFFFTLLIISINLFIFIPNLRIKIKKYIFTLVIFFVIVFVSTFLYRSFEKKRPRAIVIKEEIVVKDAPIEESDNLFEVHEGIQIKLVERRGDWLRVVLRDGREGWIPADSVEFI